MNNSTIDRLFYKAAGFFFRQPVLTLSACLMVVGISIFFMMKLEIDSSLESYLKKDDPHLAEYLAFKQRFSQKETILLGVFTKDVFAHDFLVKLDEFHQALENNVPFLSGVESLVRVKTFAGKNDTLTISAITQNLSGTRQQLADQIDLVKKTPVYQDRYFVPREDFTLMTVFVDPCLSSQYRMADGLREFEQKTLPGIQGDIPGNMLCSLTEKEAENVVHSVLQTAAQYETEDFRIFPSGLPVYKQYIKTVMFSDMVMVVSIAGCVMLVFLAFFFKQVSGVLLPVVVVFFSIASVLGLMGAAGSPVKMPTTILPSLLLVVGIGDSVHVLALYYKNIAQGMVRQSAVADAVGKTGLAILITSLTTAAGIASFSGADIMPVADLGLFGSLGVIIVFIYTLVMLPAMLALLPHRQNTPPCFLFTQNTVRFFSALAVFASRHANKILIVFFLFCLVAVSGMTRLKIGHNPLVWLPEQSSVRQAAHLIDQQINGLVNVEVMVTGQENKEGVSADILKALDLLGDRVEKQPIHDIAAGKTFSPADIVKQIHFALHDQDPDMFCIPDDDTVIAQELMLARMGAPGLVEKVCSQDGQTSRLVVYAPWRDAVAYVPFLHQLESMCEAVFKDILPSVKVMVTGMIPLLTHTLAATIESMAAGYLLSIIVVTCMMVVLTLDIKIGLAGMVPNLVPVFICLGVMGWCDFTMDMYTLLVGGIAIGLIVDDTVHFLHHFKRFYRQTHCVETACIMTLGRAGPAIVITTVLVSAGAFVFLTATLKSVNNFGAALGSIAILALLCDFLLAPALMTILYKKDRRTGT